MLLTLVSLLVGGVMYGVLVRPKDKLMPEHVFFETHAAGPLVIAHRGGAGLWPENTMYAFEEARKLGVDVIETDVRSTADGALVVIHDARVERTTDGAGSVNEMTLSELKKLDAGYRWSSDGGKSFPFRGRGLTVPTLEEVFRAFPQMSFNIEPKQETPSIIEPLCRLIRAREMTNRIVIGSFSHALIEKFRRACPEIATSASPAEVSQFLALSKGAREASYKPAMQALQVPEYAGGLRVLTESFVEAAHRHNLKVHAWTVNERADMRRLLEIGVDGLMTDYPDRLLELLDRSSAR
jgi:glycerophosphoryl diester phosphodiesterase